MPPAVCGGGSFDRVGSPAPPCCGHKHPAPSSNNMDSVITRNFFAHWMLFMNRRRQSHTLAQRRIGCTILRDDAAPVWTVPAPRTPRIHGWSRHDKRRFQLNGICTSRRTLPLAARKFRSAYSAPTHRDDCSLRPAYTGRVMQRKGHCIFSQPAEIHSNRLPNPATTRIWLMQRKCAAANTLTVYFGDTLIGK